MTDFLRPLPEQSRPVPSGATHASLVRICFADEIAIDFPAIGAVVDRMRDAFLEAEDGHEQPTAAAVLLTPREATDGAVVPLQVAVRGTCARCGGRGESWAEPCAECLGSGESAQPCQFRLSVPAGVADGTTFRFVVSPPAARPTRVEVTVSVL